MGKGKSKRYSLAGKRIERICRFVGVNYTEKTCKNFKRFIETYVFLKCDLAYLTREVPPCDMSRGARDLFEAMIAEEEIPDDKVEKLLIGLCSMMDVDAVVKRTLAMVKSFEINGDIYHLILDKLYFGDEILKNIDVQNKLHYSHSVYHLKKNEAIMLLGVTFWSEIIYHWDNSVDEMKEIENRNGRDNSLSSAREEELKNLSDEDYA